MHDKITHLTIILTEKCCLHCHNCGLDIPRIQHPQHFTDEGISKITPWIRGLDVVELSGGEPMIHPRFAEVVEHMVGVVQPKRLFMNTTAIPVARFIDVLPAFSKIVMTHYDRDTYEPDPGKPMVDNGPQIELLLRHYSGEHLIHHCKQVKRNPTTNSMPCEQASSGAVVVYPDLMLYPCCPGRGVPNPIGITMTETWKEDILRVAPNCNGCMFAKP